MCNVTQDEENKTKTLIAQIIPECGIKHDWLGVVCVHLKFKPVPSTY
jgi:hypothetical protein